MSPWRADCCCCGPRWGQREVTNAGGKQGRKRVRRDAAWGRGRRKLAERERKSWMGRRGTAGARIYPQFQKIPWQCREGSTAQCSVSACLMGLKHHTRDILAVLAGSSAPSSCWPTWQPTWPRHGHSSLKGRCEVMVASGTCLLHPRGLFLWAHGISDWSLAGKAPSAWPPLPHPAAFRKRMSAPVGPVRIPSKQQTTVLCPDMHVCLNPRSQRRSRR